MSVYSSTSSSRLSRGSSGLPTRAVFTAEPAPEIQAQQILGASPRMTAER